MKISELIEFAEEQAEIERENGATNTEEDHGASWAATLEILKVMKERGLPESLRDQTA